MPSSTTITTTLKPTLLTLPRELRNEIYTHLFLPSHTYFITPQPNPIFAVDDTFAIYIEDEIFLPTRPPLNLLHTCARTRHEVLEQTAFAFNSPLARHQPRGTATPPPPSSPLLNSSAAPATTTSTNVDDAAAPVTLTLRRRDLAYCSSRDFPPARTALSPHFHALLPLLALPKRFHFTWAWWDDLFPLLNIRPRAAIEREWDTLEWVFGEVLGCLSGVEEVEVEVRMLVGHYRNWNSMEGWDQRKRWRQMMRLLRGLVVRDGDGDGDGDGGRRRWRRVERKLVVCDTAEEGRKQKQVVFFRNEEVYGGGGREGDGNGGQGVEVLVTEETAEVPDASDEWDAVKYISRTYTRRE